MAESIYDSQCDVVGPLTPNANVIGRLGVAMRTELSAAELAEVITRSSSRRRLRRL